MKNALGLGISIDCIIITIIELLPDVQKKNLTCGVYPVIILRVN